MRMWISGGGSASAVACHGGNDSRRVILYPEEPGQDQRPGGIKLRVDGAPVLRQHRGRSMRLLQRHL